MSFEKIREIVAHFIRYFDITEKKRQLEKVQFRRKFEAECFACFTQFRKI